MKLTVGSQKLKNKIPILFSSSFRNAEMFFPFSQNLRKVNFCFRLLIKEKQLIQQKKIKNF